MKTSQTPILINLLAIARYDHMPDYPIQFMTVGDLLYTNPDEALLSYVESQQDEETGEIMKYDISLLTQDDSIDPITMISGLKEKDERIETAILEMMAGYKWFTE